MQDTTNFVEEVCAIITLELHLMSRINLPHNKLKSFISRSFYNRTD